MIEVVKDAWSYVLATGSNGLVFFFRWKKWF